MNTTVDYEPILLPIASEYARKFRSYGVETEDVAQELRIWVFRHPQKIAKWESEEEGADRPVAKSLRNEANRFCLDMKAQYLGHSEADLTYYGRNELKVLLDVVFDIDSWTNPPQSEDGGRNKQDPATGGNWLAMLADVSRAFDQLPEQDQELLRKYHEEKFTNVMLADLAGISEQAMSRKHHRALTRLLDVLGGEKPANTHDSPECECGEYVGTRRVMSNAAARAQQDAYYEET